MRPRSRLSGVLSLSLLAVTAATALLLRAGPDLAVVTDLAGDPGGWVSTQGVEQAVGVLAALGAWCLVVYLSLGVAVTALSTAHGVLGASATALSRRWVPGSVRRLAELALGATVMTGSLVGLVSTAAAAESPADAHAPAAAAGDDWPGMSTRADDEGRLRLVATGPGAVHDGPKRKPATVPAAQVPEIASKPVPPATEPGWSPDWPQAGLLTGSERAKPAGGFVDDAVVVRCGDTLWSLADHHLGHGASDDEIQAEWQRWHSANRAVVGADPNAIRPGQRLLPPGRS